ncbi:hypothetical protein [Actinomyces minihominis]|uniref:hypothetical protein n=1 Tax=Actinomyces minihominis TaxID=2002838 RepID=UPI000C070042|nr:hypothetical protein [Actinomyces minihominis]
MKKLLAASAAAIAMLSLAACSTGGTSDQSGSAGPQTQEEACALIMSSMEELSVELNKFSGDSPEELHEMVIAAKNHLTKLDRELSNQTVKDVWEPISALQIEGLEAAANEDQDGLVSSYIAMSEQTETFLEVCPAPQAQS